MADNDLDLLLGGYGNLFATPLGKVDIASRPAAKQTGTAKKAVNRVSPNPLMDLSKKVSAANKSVNRESPNFFMDLVKKVSARSRARGDWPTDWSEATMRRKYDPKSLEHAMFEFDSKSPNSPNRALVKSYMWAKAGGKFGDFSQVLPSALAMDRTIREALDYNSPYAAIAPQIADIAASDKYKRAQSAMQAMQKVRDEYRIKNAPLYGDSFALLTSKFSEDMQSYQDAVSKGLTPDKAIENWNPDVLLPQEAKAYHLAGVTPWDLQYALNNNKQNVKGLYGEDVPLYLAIKRLQRHRRHLGLDVTADLPQKSEARFQVPVARGSALNRIGDKGGLLLPSLVDVAYTSAERMAGKYYGLKDFKYDRDNALTHLLQMAEYFTPVWGQVLFGNQLGATLFEAADTRSTEPIVNFGKGFVRQLDFAEDGISAGERVLRLANFGLIVAGASHAGAKGGNALLKATGRMPLDVPGEPGTWLTHRGQLNPEASDLWQALMTFGGSKNSFRITGDMIRTSGINIADLSLPLYTKAKKLSETIVRQMGKDSWVYKDRIGKGNVVESAPSFEATVLEAMPDAVAHVLWQNMQNVKPNNFSQVLPDLFKIMLPGTNVEGTVGGGTWREIKSILDAGTSPSPNKLNNLTIGGKPFSGETLSEMVAYIHGRLSDTEAINNAAAAAAREMPAGIGVSDGSPSDPRMKAAQSKVEQEIRADALRIAYQSELLHKLGITSSPHSHIAQFAESLKPAARPSQRQAQTATPAQDPMPPKPMSPREQVTNGAQYFDKASYTADLQSKAGVEQPSGPGAINFARVQGKSTGWREVTQTMIESLENQIQAHGRATKKGKTGVVSARDRGRGKSIKQMERAVADLKMSLIDGTPHPAILETIEASDANKPVENAPVLRNNAPKASPEKLAAAEVVKPPKNAAEPKQPPPPEQPGQVKPQISEDAPKPNVDEAKPVQDQPETTAAIQRKDISNPEVVVHEKIRIKIPKTNEFFTAKSGIVSLDDVQASHLDNGSDNPLYSDNKTQNRDRTLPSYVEQVRNRAKNLDVEDIGNVATSVDHGAPTVDHFGNGIAGHGRLASIKLAQREYPENYKRYVEHLRELVPEKMLPAFDKIKNPVLVAIPSDGNADIVQRIGEGSNTGAASKLTVVEEAYDDASSLPETILSDLKIGSVRSIEELLHRAGNRNVVMKWVHGLTQQEHTAMLSSDGGAFSEQAYERLGNALLAKILGPEGKSVLQSSLQDAEMSKSLMSGLQMSTPGLIEALQSDKPGDTMGRQFVNDITAAIKILNDLHVSGKTTKAAKTTELLNGYMGKDQTTQRKIAMVLTQAGSAQGIKDAISTLATGVVNRDGGLFPEDRMETVGEVVASAFPDVVVGSHYDVGLESSAFSQPVNAPKSSRAKAGGSRSATPAKASQPAPKTLKSHNAGRKPEIGIPIEPPANRVKNIKVEDVRTALSAVTNIVFTKFASKGAGGTYYPTTLQTGVKNPADIGVFAHEMAHALWDIFGKIGRSDWSTLDPELREFAKHGRSSANDSSPKEVVREEGLAEFIRHYMQSPLGTEMFAPNTYARMVASVGPEIMKRIEHASNLYRSYLAASPIETTMAHIKTDNHQPTLLDQVRKMLQFKDSGVGFETLLWDRVRTELFDEYAMVVKAVDVALKRRGIDIRTLPESKNPIVLLRAFPYRTLRISEMLRNGVFDPRQPGKQGKSATGKDLTLPKMLGPSLLEVFADVAVLPDEKIGPVLDAVRTLLVSNLTIDNLAKEMKKAADNVANFSALSKERLDAKLADMATQSRASADAAIRQAHSIIDQLTISEIESLNNQKLAPNVLKTKISRVIKKADKQKKNAEARIHSKAISALTSDSNKASDASRAAVEKYQAKAFHMAKAKADKISGIGAEKGGPVATAQSAIRAIDLMPEKDLVYKTASLYRTYIDALLEYQVSGGYVTKQYADDLRRNNQEYVSLERVMGHEEGSGWVPEMYVQGSGSSGQSKTIGKSRKLIRQRVGSGRDIIDPFAMAIEATHRVVTEVDRNEIVRALVDLMRQPGRKMRDPNPADLQSILHETEPNAPSAFKVRSIEQRVIDDTDADGNTTQKTVDVLVEKWYTSTNDDLNKQILGITDIQVSGNPVAKMSQASVSIFRNLTTLTPKFLIANRIRDIMDVIQMSSHPSWLPKYWAVMRGSKDEEFLYNTFAQGLNRSWIEDAPSTWYGKQSFLLDKMVNEARASGNKSLTSMLSNMAHRYHQMVGRSEMAPRIALSRAARESDAYQQKLIRNYYDAELWVGQQLQAVINFNEGGRASKFLSRYAIPFFNVGFVSYRKYYEAWRKHPEKMAVRFALGQLLPALFCVWLTSRDKDDWDEYMQMPAWQKDSNFVVRNRTGVGPRWIMVPKVYIGGQLASLFERLAIHVSGADNRAFDGFSASAVKGFMPYNVDSPILPVALSGAYQAASNHSFFYDAPIVPKGEADLALPLREFADQQSSRAGQIIAKAFNMDPREADHLIRSYLSGTGEMIMAASNLGRDGFGISSAKNVRPWIGMFGDAPLFQARDPRWVMDKAKESGVIANPLMELIKLRSAAKTIKDQVMIDHIIYKISKDLRGAIESATEGLTPLQKAQVAKLVLQKSPFIQRGRKKSTISKPKGLKGIKL